MVPFKPSKLAQTLTTILDRGQAPQQASDLVVKGGRPVNRRNPLYMTDAQLAGQYGSTAYFMANRDPKAREGSNDYEVLPGGTAVYFHGKERDLVPFGPNDIPDSWLAQRAAPVDLYDLRRSMTDPPQNQAVFSFPDDRSFNGNGQRPSTKFVGRKANNGGY